ncbi:S-adenosylmethionine decarboxylase [Paenibacillus silviterrae]|uniref:S-adenosylmethionine decarboxylase n=1 Tax=Paenibacillus silviterrae TaxID=3242194 RepID=UPI0025430FD0|nr:S-adenosylmethionine decarboxylase [Paenibacillus chinjuensis]
MRNHRKKWFMYAILALLIVWPISQIVGMLQTDAHREEADKLLYKVSFFQMELLGSYLQDAGVVRDTESLAALRQSLYTANYTHDHLVLAYGESALTKLESLSQLMQYILRLQIGGQRPLKTDELQTLSEVNRLYADLYDAYGKLLSGGDIVSSENTRLAKADKAIAELLKKKQLQ